MKPDKTMGNNNPDTPFPIVGIGASAGGLHSLDCFLEALPKDFDFAVVFIQHLSPAHKSLMPELLRSKWLDYEFIEIEDGLQLLPGRLYLCPPAVEVRIHKGAFRVVARPDRHIHFPIDEFLVSLAEASAELAVAVIFSGAGTDGVRGIQAVRTEGGTVFVQDPATAQFPELPQAAIKTGQVDSVLPPPSIAREIVKLLRSGAVTEAPDNLINPDELEPFYLLIREKTGHRFNHYKNSVISRRIRRRMYLRGISSVTEYLNLVADKPGEAALLASDLMIGVTSFFRDRLAWKALRIGVIRKLVVSDGDAPIRVWTPACATGEESYSIAMMLRDELELAGRKRELQVFATDVNDRALEKAREGKYPASISADVSREFMRKFFTYSDDGISVTVSKEMRQHVIFAKQDILTDPPFSRLDLVICRNLLIYLEPDAQEKCITLFHYALRPGGYLFLGNAESLGRKSMLFKSLAHKKCRVFEKVETGPSSRLPLTVPFAAERAAVTVRQQPALDQLHSVIQLSQDSLLEKYGPAAVTINQHYDILYHNGTTHRYLKQPRGAPTQNLLELLPESLRNRIRGAIYKATQEAGTFTIRTGITSDEGQKRQVSVHVSTIKENLFLIVFREKEGAPSGALSETTETVCVEEPAVRQLEIELSSTRQELQTNIEQLKSLNEEFHSSNEELQASNEEMETSREELQSLNEELITVNTQLQSKVEEQEETNNDLNNFLSSTNIPTIFLDHRFRVKRYTPAITKLIKLIPSDVGRQIIDMSQEALGPDIISDAQSVLENLVPVNKEIRINRVWYVRTALPYRTHDNRIEGVVVTYNDVTELKRAEERSSHLASFPQLNPNPIIEIDFSGKVTFCNPASLKTLESLGIDKGDVYALLPPDLDAILSDWDKRNETTIHREIIIKDRVFYHTIHLIPQFDVARIYAYDITERKKAEEVQGRLAAIVESADDAIIGKDLNGIIQTWNVGAENIFGYKAEEVIGRPVSLLVPPGHTDEVPEILARIKQGGHIEHFETVRMRKDGTIIPVSLTFSPIKDASGRIIGASKIAHDITDRKQAEEALRQSEERYRTLFNTLMEGFCIIEMIFDSDDRPVDYRFLEINPAFEAQTGLQNAQGRLMRELAPDHEAHWFEIYGNIALTGEPARFVNEARALNRWYDVYAYRYGRPESRQVAIIFNDITELKRAEEALRTQAELLNLAHDAILVRDIADKITFWNPGAERTYGWTHDEAMGRVNHDLFKTRCPKPLIELNAEVAEKGSWEGELIHTGKDGREIVVASRWSAQRDMTGRQVGILEINRDITERKRAEEKLRESEQLYRAIGESIDYGVWVCAPDGRNIYASESFLKLVGMTQEQCSNFGWGEVLHPDDAERTIAAWQECVRTMSKWDIEHRFRGVDGQWHPILARGVPVKNERGEVIYWAGINLDIKSIKQTEESLLESERHERERAEELATLIEAVPMPVFIARDPECLHLTGNRLAGEILRIPHGNELSLSAPSETKPHNFRPLKDGRELRLDELPAQQACCGVHVKDFEFTLAFDDGLVRHVLGYGTPLLDNQGRPRGTVSVLVDITELKQAEEALKQSNTELAAANREMESFIYSVSHDLRGPLRHISGFAELVMKNIADKAGEKEKRYLARIHEGTEKMGRLIDDLLNLSRMSRQEIQRTSINLSEIASSIIADLREAHPTRNVDVDIKEGLTAFADRGLIEVVLSNLLGNAWKFTGKTEHARIEFGTVEQDGKIIYYVRDNGAGFDQKYVGKIFWPFHRLHSGSAFEGTGIGLAIVDRIISRHGGKVWAEGIEKKGATIYFSLT